MNSPGFFTRVGDGNPITGQPEIFHRQTGNPLFGCPVIIDVELAILHLVV